MPTRISSSPSPRCSKYTNAPSTCKALEIIACSWTSSWRSWVTPIGGGSTHPRHLNRASHHPKISQIWMKIPLNQIQIVSLRNPVPNLKNRNQPWHRLFNLDDLGVPYGVLPSDSHGSSWGDIRSSWCGVKLLALARDRWLMLLLKDGWKSQVSLFIIMKH